MPFKTTLLYLVGVVYSLVVSIRKKLYDWGVFSSFRPKAYTISVGNLAAGGAGKTPCVIFLAEMLLKKGACGVVLRPYKALQEKATKPIRAERDMPAALIGDEAAVVLHRVPQALVWVGNKQAAARLLDQQGGQYIIIDDGFQHFGIKRDCDIVVIDAHNPFSRGRLFRERPEALSRADYIILNEKHKPCDCSAVKQAIRRYSSAPIIHARYVLDGFYDRTGAVVSIEKGTKVALFCAIAEPVYFKETVDLSGLEVLDSLFLPDHESCFFEALDAFWQKAQSRGAQYLLCTEKDIVKYKPLFPELCWLKISMQIDEADLFMF